MKTGKALICTATMTVMLVLIMAGLLLLRYTLAFFVIAGVFAALGLGMSSGQLFRWLARETEDEDAPELPAVFAEAPDAPEREPETLDEIIREVRGNA